jgi:geranylgeranyl diphosphate synthase type II
MDNDDMRRGKPACHITFGEANALLAGDALLTDAFKVALSTDIEQKDRVVKAGVVLAECAGSDGMIAGQVIDLKYEDTKAPLLSVIDMYRLKTGALLIAAAKIGCILGGATEKEIEAAESFATNLGLAFQIKDDILDITSSTEVLGKPVGSDSEQNKSTYVTYKGLQTAQDDVEKYTADAIKSLEMFGEKAKKLQQFAKGLINRNI